MKEIALRDLYGSANAYVQRGKICFSAHSFILGYTYVYIQQI